jgi:nicotinamide mononucleotide (NMN) deamidase PncC
MNVSQVRCTRYMNSNLEYSITRIHKSKTKLVMSVSGVGSQSINWLLSVPGASKTLLEATIPYSNESLNRYIGKIPGQYVSKTTVLSMAKAAYIRGTQYGDNEMDIIGVSCTGAISTNRKRKGDNQAFIGLWGPRLKYVAHLILKKGERSRVEEEELVSSLIVQYIEEKLLGNSVLNEFPSDLDSLVNGHISSITSAGSNLVGLDKSFKGGILSGSFNPIHQGHIELSKLASDILGAPVAFEISITNVDKPPLRSDEIKKRVSQFEKSETVILTCAPLFAEKSSIFPNSTFIIGNDTALRLVDPKYYDNNVQNMYTSLQKIKDTKCNFLVAGRLQNSEFKTISDMAIPEAFISMFKSIPESQFRMDLSSTDLRNNRTRL